MTAVEIPLGPRARRARRIRRRALRRPRALAGLFVALVFIVVAIFAPQLAPYSPDKNDFQAVLAGPSSKHLLGTDDLGRDTWSRILYSARTDLRIAFLAVLFPFIIGTALGLFTGYFAGAFDGAVNWLVSVVVAFPVFVLIIALSFVLGPATRNIYIAITLVGWVSYTRIIRAEVLSAKRRDWMLAARAGGLSTPRILFRHLLPNVITQAVVFAFSDIVLDMVFIVTLGYFGLGVQRPTVDWGQMISDGQTFLTTRWELATIPGIAVVVTALGLALMADGLADLLRPE
jgi:peptide/nickel transport system permease protein